MARSPSFSPSRGGVAGPGYGGGRRRSRSRSRSPPRPHRKGNSDRYAVEVEDRASLLVRNIPRDTRGDDLRIPFERYGAVRDVYLPKDYYTGEPRGFGFVQFISADDAAEAQYHLDRTIMGGREITVVFAKESRKKPHEMRVRERMSRGGPYGGGGGYGGRYSPHRRSRSWSRSPRGRYSESPPPAPSNQRQQRTPVRSPSPSGRPGGGYNHGYRRSVSPPPRGSSPPVSPRGGNYAQRGRNAVGGGGDRDRSQVDAHGAY